MTAGGGPSTQAADRDEDQIDWGRRWIGAVVATAVAGAAMRWWLLAGPVGAVDSDGAVGGLMAKHMLDGEYTALFWGINYAGSQEVFLSSLVFRVVGVGTAGLMVVSIGLHAATVVVTWRLGLRTVGPKAALVGAGLLWVWPASGVLRSIRPSGFYASGPLLVGATLLLVVRIVETSQPRRDWLLLGLVCGLGWWATPQFAWVAIPALAYLIVANDHDPFTRLLLLPPGFIVGALPWLWRTATTLGATLDSGKPGLPGGSYSSRLQGFFEEGLPIGLGLREPFSGRWLPVGALGVAAYGGVLLLLSWMVVRRFIAAVAELRWLRHARDSWALASTVARTAGLLAVVALVYPFLVAISSLSFFHLDGRYLVMLAPALSLLVAEGLSALRLGVPALALAAALTMLGLQDTRSVRNAPGDFAALEATLIERHVSHGYAEYWVSYQVTFETNERVVLNPLTDTPRYAPYTEAIAAAEAPAVVFLSGSRYESSLRTLLDTNNVPYERIDVGGFTVYLPEGKILVHSAGDYVEFRLPVTASS